MGNLVQVQLLFFREVACSFACAHRGNGTYAMNFFRAQVLVPFYVDAIEADKPINFAELVFAFLSRQLI